MKLLNEYLLSKTNPKAISGGYVAFKQLFNDIYETHVPEDVSDYAKKYFEENEFDHFRVYWTQRAKMTATKYEKWKQTAFMNLLKTDMAYSLIFDIIYNAHKDSRDFEHVSIYHNESVIVVTDEEEEVSFAIENIEQGAELNPNISSYHARSEDWIEFSSKPLAAYIDGMEERHWDMFDQLCDDAKEACQEEFDIEIEILGRGGKHVCCLPTYNAFHKYDKIKEYIDKVQDNIIQDMKEMIKEL